MVDFVFLAWVLKFLVESLWYRLNKVFAQVIDYIMPKN
jgi:hypothetical protein